MPLTKLVPRPGVDRESTTYAAEGTWFESDKVRFRSGFPEKIGGWINISGNTGTYSFNGVCRHLRNWISLAYANLMGVGTNQKYYIENGGQFFDVTPLTTASPVTLGATAFSTVSGSPLVTVTIASHGMSAGTYVTFAGVTDFAGFTGASSLNREFEAVTVPDGSHITIINTANANATTTGGTAGTASIQIPAGNAVFSVGNGWNAGTWPAYRVRTFTDKLASAGGNTTIVVTDTAHGLETNDYVYFASIAVDPCGISKSVLMKAFQVTKTGADTYTISTVIGSDSYTTSATAGSGGLVTAYYAASPDHVAGGASYSATSRGWGAGADVNVGVGQQLRTWSADTFGEQLLFAPRNWAIYIWKPASQLSVAGTDPGRGALLSAVSGNDGYCPHTVLEVIASDVQRFVIALGANPYTPGVPATAFDPMLVRWCDQEDYTTWIPAPTNQAGEFKLAGGSTIIAGKVSRQEVLIWTDSSLFTMQYLGPPYIWGFNLLMDNISIISHEAVASANNQTFWMGKDKFYIYSGRVDTLPCTLRAYIFGDLNFAQAHQIVAGTNEGYNEVWWHYPSADSNVNDRYVVYNHLENVWYYGTINRTAWLDSPLRDYPMAAFSVQNSYLSIAMSDSDTTFTLLNGNSYPDSGTVLIGTEWISYSDREGNSFTGCTRGVTGGTAAASHAIYAPATYLVPNQVMYHENGVDDCSTAAPQPIDAYIQSADFDIGDGHNFGFVTRMLPDVTFEGSNIATPEVTVTLRPRQNSGAPYATEPAPNVISANDYTPYEGHARSYTVQQFTQQVWTRLRGRQMAFKIESNTLGVHWQMGAMRLEIRQDGRKS